MPVNQRTQILQTNVTQLQNPTWLSTKCDRDYRETNRASDRVKALNLVPPDYNTSALNHSATQPPYRKEFNSHWIGSGHQNGYRCTVFEHHMNVVTPCENTVGTQTTLYTHPKSNVLLPGCCTVQRSALYLRIVHQFLPYRSVQHSVIHFSEILRRLHSYRPLLFLKEEQVFKRLNIETCQSHNYRQVSTKCQERA